VNDNGSKGTREVLTLFLVVVDTEGQSMVVLDPNSTFTPQRLATPKDVYPALANVLADYQAIKTAEAVMSFQTVLARQLQQQAEASVAPEES
jgi:hypothetical protein